MKIEYGKFMYLVAYHLYACVTRNYVIVVHIYFTKNLEEAKKRMECYFKKKTNYLMEFKTEN